MTQPARSPLPVDAFGDALPEGALVSCGTLRLCHPADAAGWPQSSQALCFSPDARRVLSAAGTTVHVWDVEDGREVAVLSGHTGRVNDLCFIAPTSLVTAAADGTVRLWDVEGGAELRRWHLECEDIYRLALSPDGRTLLVGTWAPSGFSVLDLATGEVLTRVHPDGSAGGPDVLAFSPEGSRVLLLERYFEERRLCVFDTATWALLWATERVGMEFAPAWAVFSPEGARIRSPVTVPGVRYGVREYDARTGEVLGTAPQRWGRPVPLEEGRVARVIKHRLVVFRDGGLERWMELPAGISDECKPVVAPGGRRACFRSGAAALLLLDLPSRKPWPEHAHRDSVTQVTFSRDGEHLLTYSPEGMLRTWERGSGREVGHGRRMHGDSRVLQLRGGRVLDVEGREGVFIHDVLAGTRVKLEGEDCSTFSMVWSDDCALVAALVDAHVEGERTVQVHDTRTGKRLRSVSIPVTNSCAHALSRTGRWLVTPRKVREPAPGHTELWVWDLKRGTPRCVVRLGDGPAELSLVFPLVGFSPDEAWLYFLDAVGAAVLVDVANPERRVRLGVGTSVSAVAFSEDGTCVATGELRGGIRVWSTEGRCLGALAGHRAAVRALAFSEDGGFLASGSGDTTALVWPRSAWA
jgi:WD40 repeat protein